MAYWSEDSRAKVDAWFERCQNEMDPHDFVCLWLQLAFHPSHVDIYPPDLFSQWVDFSRWERQAALYKFGPVLERIASEKAHELCQEAREHEPL